MPMDILGASQALDKKLRKLHPALKYFLGTEPGIVELQRGHSPGICVMTEKITARAKKTVPPYFENYPVKLQDPTGNLFVLAQG